MPAVKISGKLAIAGWFIKNIYKCIISVSPNLSFVSVHFSWRTDVLPEKVNGEEEGAAAVKTPQCPSARSPFVCEAQHSWNAVPSTLVSLPGRNEALPCRPPAGRLPEVWPIRPAEVQST